MKDKKAPPAQWKNAAELVSRYKFVLLIVLVGVLLLLLPDGKGEQETAEAASATVEEDFSVEALEEKLAATLEQIDGAGRVRVMLTVQSGMKRVFAQDGSLEQGMDEMRRETETVVVSAGTGHQETVLVQQIYPQFQGALIVAGGGGDPGVRLKLTEAVAALTGLGTDKISICKGK